MVYASVDWEERAGDFSAREIDCVPCGCASRTPFAWEFGLRVSCCRYQVAWIPAILSHQRRPPQKHPAALLLRLRQPIRVTNQSGF